MKAAFIGLGVMGYPMAGHLKNAGIDVCVYNRTAEKAQRWVEEYKGSMADSPAAAASGCDVVLSCVAQGLCHAGASGEGLSCNQACAVR